MFKKDLTIAGFDPEVAAAMEAERRRQEEHIELIASENYTSPRILEAQGSVLTNKYAEGYPAKRYYGGCEHVDVVEQLAIDRACELYKADYANVQPHAGSQANAAVYTALLQPGDTLLGMALAHGGHLTHGSHVNFSGQNYNAVQYGLNPETGEVDYEQVEQLAAEHRPKMIVAGFSAYSRVMDWQRFRDISDSVGALLMVDMAHVSGLIATDLYPSPVPVADVVTSTTHKTLRGPRSGFIIARENEEIHQEDQLHGVPRDAGGAADACHRGEGGGVPRGRPGPSSREYQCQVLANAKAMAEVFIERNYKVVSGGTDDHLFPGRLYCPGTDRKGG